MPHHNLKFLSDIEKEKEREAEAARNRAKVIPPEAPTNVVYSSPYVTWDKSVSHIPETLEYQVTVGDPGKGGFGIPNYPIGSGHRANTAYGRRRPKEDGSGYYYTKDFDIIIIARDRYGQSEQVIVKVRDNKDTRGEKVLTAQEAAAQLEREQEEVRRKTKVVEEAPKPEPEIRFTETRSGQHRWKIRNSDGKNIAYSRLFKTKEEAEKALHEVKAILKEE